MKRLYFSLALVFSFSIHAQETETTVLGLLLPGGDPEVANDYMLSLPQYWPSSETGITVNLVSGGVPLPFVSPTSGDPVDDLMNAMNLVGSLRNQHGADIVIFFTDLLEDGQVCGHVEQTNWIDNGGGGQAFIPDSQGLDLRGSEDSFGAIISTDFACAISPEVLVHEYGHLHGAGHVGGQGLYLFPDSHAYHVDAGFLAFKTIVAEGDLRGHQTFTYSAYPGSANNRGTLVVTAQSVANYRVPQCELTAPINVQGVLTNACTEFQHTTHLVFWDDTCPAATAYYQVWASQPLGAPYTFEGSVPVDITGVSVFGTAAWVKVKACDFGTCSPLSSSRYLAGYLCFPQQ